MAVALFPVGIDAHVNLNDGPVRTNDRPSTASFSRTVNPLFGTFAKFDHRSTLSCLA